MAGTPNGRPLEPFDPARFPALPIVTPDAFAFPTLPIVTPGPPRKTSAEKYGGLWYLGLGGLAVVIALIGWFGYGVWSLREVWANIYVLHDDSKPKAERVRAAFRLAEDGRLTQANLVELVQRGEMPDLARYVLAERLAADSIAGDPGVYALDIADKPGRPAWLRALLVRPLALKAGSVRRYPVVPMDALIEGDADPLVRAWADCARALTRQGDPAALARLRALAREPGPARDVAAILVESIDAKPKERPAIFERATRLMRTVTGGPAEVWEGWDAGRPKAGGQAAPDLQPIRP